MIINSFLSNLDRSSCLVACASGSTISWLRWSGRCGGRLQRSERHYDTVLSEEELLSQSPRGVCVLCYLGSLRARGIGECRDSALSCQLFFCEDNFYRILRLSALFCHQNKNSFFSGTKCRQVNAKVHLLLKMSSSLGF